MPKYFGVGAFYIEKDNTQGRHFLTEDLNLELPLEDIGLNVGDTYTLSAFVKTEGISKSTTPKGASVFVRFKDTNGVTHDLAESNYINGTLDWQKVETNFVVPSDAENIYVNMGITGETGTAYFDNVQLEEGPVSNRFNCIENPDFTYVDLNREGQNMPCYWEKSNSCSSTDIRIQPTDIDYPSFTDYPKKLDEKCFRIVGESDPAIAYDKRVFVDTEVPEGKAGDVYSVGCWAKADSVPNVIKDKNAAISSTDRVFGLVLEFTYIDNSIQTFLVPFNPNSSEWQYACDRIQAPDDYKNIKLMGCYYNNANTAYFDGFQLYKEEFGESYEYDTNGNLTEITSMNNKTTSYEYNSTNDMTSSISSGGSETKVEYDNHNPTDLITAENEKSANTYDSYGNPLTNTVGNNDLFIKSSISYTTNGNYIIGITDPAGNTVNYDYDNTKGTLKSFTDAKAKTTNYSYDDNLDRLTGVSKTVDGATASNTYIYKDSSNNETDHLTKITHNGFDYNFNYDSLWNITNVYVGSQTWIFNGKGILNKFKKT